MSSNPSKQEIDDLAKLQDLLNQTARSAMDAMRMASQHDSEMLRHTGHKTNADAVLSSYKYYQKMMDNAIKAHIKQYPDE